MNDSVIPNRSSNVSGAYYRTQSIPKSFVFHQEPSWKQCVGDHWLYLHEPNDTTTSRWILTASTNGSVMYDAVTQRDYLPDPTKHHFPALSYTDSIDYRVICSMHSQRERIMTLQHDVGFGSQRDNASIRMNPPTQSETLRFNLPMERRSEYGVSHHSYDWIWCLALGALLVLIVAIGICILRIRATNQKPYTETNRLKTGTPVLSQDRDPTNQSEMEQDAVDQTDITEITVRRLQ